MMKPKGRTEQEVGMLEFLEDIIGTSRLKEPIAELNQRVEELRSVRDEKVPGYRQWWICVRAAFRALIVAYGWMLPREAEMVLSEQVCQGSKV